jgi:hypothetical protein
MPLLKPDCACDLQRKARTVTVFDAEQSVLRSPICLGIIAKYGHCSRISARSERTFSAVQTSWRRERDSITAISSKSLWFLHIAIIPCVYEGFKHILDLGSVV